MTTARLYAWAPGDDTVDLVCTFPDLADDEVRVTQASPYHAPRADPIVPEVLAAGKVHLQVHPAWFINITTRWTPEVADQMSRCPLPPVAMESLWLAVGEITARLHMFMHDRRFGVLHLGASTVVAVQATYPDGAFVQLERRYSRGGVIDGPDVFDSAAMVFITRPAPPFGDDWWVSQQRAASDRLIAAAGPRASPLRWPDPPP